MDQPIFVSLSDTITVNLRDVVLVNNRLAKDAGTNKDTGWVVVWVRGIKDPFTLVVDSDKTRVQAHAFMELVYAFGVTKLP